MQTTTTTRDGSVHVTHTDSPICGRSVALGMFIGGAHIHVSLSPEEAAQIGEALVQHAKAPADEVAA